MLGLRKALTRTFFLHLVEPENRLFRAWDIRDQVFKDSFRVLTPEYLEQNFDSETKLRVLSGVLAIPPQSRRICPGGSPAGRRKTLGTCTKQAEYLYCETGKCQWRMDMVVVHCKKWSKVNYEPYMV